MRRSAITSILGNGATLGGHVTVGDWAVVGAFSGVHQFCRIGRHAFIGGIQRDHAGRAAVFEHGERAAQSRCSARTASGWSGAGSRRESIEALQTALRLLTRAQAEYLAGDRADSRRSAAVRRGGGTARVHPDQRARRHQVDALRADRRERPLPAAGAGKRAAAGPRGRGDRASRKRRRRKSRRWRRAAIGFRSGN